LTAWDSLKAGLTAFTYRVEKEENPLYQAKTNFFFGYLISFLK
jgi:hypothetical protein